TPRVPKKPAAIALHRSEQRSFVDFLRDFRQGVNDFGNAHYDGPQPPKGHGVHHYHFRLSALDVETLESSGETAIADLLAHAGPHMIATAELVGGTYESR
ncbi:MAG: hypothetical protein E5V99_21775, partial [Mesorhizobium sp.]